MRGCLVVVLGAVACIRGVAGYKIIQDSLSLHNCNKGVINAEGRISNGLCVNFKLKEPVPPTSKVLIKAYRKVNNNFVFSGISIKTTLREVLGLKSFDLDSLFNKCFKPVAKWPLVVGTDYRCDGWSPDVTKFPPALPAGEWKTELGFMYPNGTTFVDVHWLVRIVN
ncbi:hypothetical protein PPYR_14176 [Photinus pyralis]|uniref:MD-2-related lipid-recognition domain-containing protein n=1 Tax=Photinus pyralis TaxID=7054 RepID=A0A5N4A4I1_PHOPY|nr:uncharacterized protein LOC116180629 [Photinus pyralis]KAB0792217.1 hypothetical protein PPYR_14176 [Photinus pyralis]